MSERSLAISDLTVPLSRDPRFDCRRCNHPHYLVVHALGLNDARIPYPCEECHRQGVFCGGDDDLATEGEQPAADTHCCARTDHHHHIVIGGPPFGTCYICSGDRGNYSIDNDHYYPGGTVRRTTTRR